MTEYKSLIGGFYSYPEDPRLVNGKHYPISVRINNPGAINSASWEKTLPGYLTTRMLPDHQGRLVNPATIFRSPEEGVGAWYELMKRYRAAGAKTLQDIIRKYGGGDPLYASNYVPSVARWTGFPATKEIVLDDDAILLPFAKAMFRMEAGIPTPLSDAQILYGFKLARGYRPGVTAAIKVVTSVGVAGAASAVTAQNAGHGHGWAVALGIIVVIALLTIVAIVLVRHWRHKNSDDRGPVTTPPLPLIGPL